MIPDVFFVSSYEPDAEHNWKRLLYGAPHARRISGLSSIHAAFAACAEASRTPHFFMVDGDNWMMDGFAFEFDFEPGPEQAAVWRARNPVNGLTYGNGAIKLLPAAMIGATLRTDAIDLGTSIGPAYRVVDVLASEHRFNTSSFDTWRTAFRECVKLSARLVPGQNEIQVAARLDTWCAEVPAGPAAPAYARWCVTGAREGRAYGEKHAGQLHALSYINDFAWLSRLWAGREPTEDAGRGTFN
jgi:hypothetical protein